MAGVWVARSKTDVEIGPKNQTRSFWGEFKEKGAPERQFGHLLVQNRSQEVQEHFGSRGKAKNLKKTLKIKDFGV